MPVRLRLPIALLALVTSLAACDDSPGGLGDPKKQGHSSQPIDQTSKPRVQEAPPDFSKAVAVVPAYDKGTGKLTVTLKVAKGFHAYAPGETVGRPVELVVDQKNGWTLEGAPTLPQGVEKDLGELGKSMILEGDVNFTATVKGGTGPISGAVKAMVCTDKACDRPKSHPFDVAVP